MLKKFYYVQNSELFSRVIIRTRLILHSPFILVFLQIDKNSQSELCVRGTSVSLGDCESIGMLVDSDQLYFLQLVNCVYRQQPWNTAYDAFSSIWRAHRGCCIICCNFWHQFYVFVVLVKYINKTIQNEILEIAVHTSYFRSVHIIH